METGEVFGWILIVVVVLFLLRRMLPVKGVTDLEADQFKSMLHQQTPRSLIDVREAHEFKQGHIRGAVNMPLSGFRAHLDQLPKDVPAFVYCQSGMRSRSAARLLVKHGCTEVYNLRGGVMRWTDKLVK